MLNCLHRFKAVIILFILFGSFAFGQNKILVRDAAIFKIDSKVFFLNQLNAQIRSIRGLKCLLDRSLLLEVIGRTEKATVRKLGPKSIDWENEREWITSLVNIQKFLLHFSSVNRSESGPLPKSSQGKRKKCLSSTKAKWKEVQALWSIEAALRQRFPFDRESSAGNGLLPFTQAVSQKFQHELLF